MMSDRTIATLVIAALLAAAAMAAHAEPAVPVGEHDLGGTVSGPDGPEAGAWVIAETTELPTRYAKVVVTDDRGRYLIPDLSQARYSVWARGYGLVDSAKQTSAPGRTFDRDVMKIINL